MNEQQYQKMAEAPGFVAALDQSGGSTPKTLQRYGVETWADEAEMFDLVHAMRSRIMASPSFDGERILATILFAHTVDREVEGLLTPHFLWDVKHIVPILKVDKGLMDEVDGAQLMKPIDDLDDVAHLLADHPVVHALAGDLDVKRALAEPLPEVPEGDRLPDAERGVGDLDPTQQAAVQHVVSGRHLVLDARTGADAPAVVAAILADAAASGRSAVYLPGNRRAARATWMPRAGCCGSPASSPTRPNTAGSRIGCAWPPPWWTTPWKAWW